MERNSENKNLQQQAQNVEKDNEQKPQDPNAQRNKAPGAYDANQGGATGRTNLASRRSDQDFAAQDGRQRGNLDRSGE